MQRENQKDQSLTRTDPGYCHKGNNGKMGGIVSISEKIILITSLLLFQVYYYSMFISSSFEAFSIHNKSLIPFHFLTQMSRIPSIVKRCQDKFTLQLCLRVLSFHMPGLCLTLFVCTYLYCQQSLVCLSRLRLSQTKDFMTFL